MKARKKPVEVEVMQLKMVSHRVYRKCKEFVGDFWIDCDEMPNGLPGIKTLEGVSGEIYPCKPDIFEKTYEVIE